MGRVQFNDDEHKKAVCERFRDLADYGISFDSRDIERMLQAYKSAGYGMDADLVDPLTTASITTPIQFLQAWLPGFVEIITAVRRIDMLVGITTQGNWSDEEIVQGVIEKVGNARLYNDVSNSPQTSWNVNYERRTICLLYTSPSPRDRTRSRMPSSA